MGQPTSQFYHDAPAASYHLVVVPSDTINFQVMTTALYIGSAGAVSVVGADNQSTVFPNLPVGWHPIRCIRVNSTGTTVTANNIIAVWG